MSGKPQRAPRRRKERKVVRKKTEESNTTPKNEGKKKVVKEEVSDEEVEVKEVITVTKDIHEDLQKYFEEIQADQIKKQTAEEEAEEGDDEEEDKPDGFRWFGTQVVVRDSEVEFTSDSPNKVNRAWNALRNIAIRRFNNSQGDDASVPNVFLNRNGPYNFTHRSPSHFIKSNGDVLSEDDESKFNPGFNFTSSHHRGVDLFLKNAGDGQVYIRTGNVVFGLNHDAKEDVPEDSENEDGGEEEEEDAKPAEKRQPRKPRRKYVEFSNDTLAGWKSPEDYSTSYRSLWTKEKNFQMQQTLQSRGWTLVGRNTFIETKSIAEGKWNYSFFKWEPAPKEEVEEKEENEDAEAEDAEGEDAEGEDEESDDGDDKKKQNNRRGPLRGSWVALPKLDDVPSRYNAGTRGYFVNQRGGRSILRDVFIQVLPEDEGSDDLGAYDDQILEVLNEDTEKYNPRTKTHNLTDKVPFVLAEFNLIQRVTFSSPCGRFTAHLQNINEGTKRNVMNELSFMCNQPLKSISSCAISDLADRIHDWFSISSAQATTQKDPRTSKPGGRASSKLNDATLLYSAEDLAKLSIDELKRLYSQYKKLTTQIHISWVQAAMDAKRVSQPVKGKKKNNRRQGRRRRRGGNRVS